MTAVGTEQTPTVLRRLLALRAVPQLTGTALSDLATLAENVVETTVDPGTVLATAGQRVPALYVVTDGHVEIHGPERRRTRCGPHELFGHLEVLAGRSADRTAVAVSEVRLLQLSASELREVLEDSFSLLQVMLRELAQRLAVVGAGVLGRRSATSLPQPLGMVDRLILLRQQMPFARGRLQALASLAHSCDEVTWTPGTVLARAGELARGAWVIVDGTLKLVCDRVTRVVGPGDSVGVLEALSGAPYGASIEAVTSGRGLRSTSAAILDVVEDHTDLGLAMLAALANALLDVERAP